RVFPVLSSNARPASILRCRVSCRRSMFRIPFVVCCYPADAAVVTVARQFSVTSEYGLDLCFSIVYIAHHGVHPGSRNTTRRSHEALETARRNDGGSSGGSLRPTRSRYDRIGCRQRDRQVKGLDVRRSGTSGQRV